MSASRKRHTRKARRQARQALAHGPGAKPSHRLLSGRTGSVGAKRLANGSGAPAKSKPSRPGSNGGPPRKKKLVDVPVIDWERRW